MNFSSKASGLFFALLAILLLLSCNKKGLDGDPVESINENLNLPANAYLVYEDDVEVDNSITIGGGSSTRMPLDTDTQMDAQITFNAPNGNVTAVGMRFGTSGPINMVPVPGAQGQTSGTANLPFSLSASTCANLSEVCHDIKCYEFAQTSDGRISRANIRDVALMCGGCDEPSCQSLIQPPCTNGGGGGGTGTGSFTYNGSTYSGTGICGTGTGGSAVTSTSGVSAILSNLSSGSNSLTDGYYTGYCSSCPALQVTNSSGTSYIATSGNATWSGSTITFSASLREISGYGTRSVTGTINCP